MDLYYLKSARTRLQAEDVFDDLNSLVRAVDRSSVFDHEIGYICRVEQGEDMGFHIHAAFSSTDQRSVVIVIRQARLANCGSS